MASDGIGFDDQKVRAWMNSYSARSRRQQLGHVGLPPDKELHRVRTGYYRVLVIRRLQWQSM
ncbi:hypothetical protein PI125_g2710 [Phytophthora idaei]|nr:hypothetical protein PI125_g2710 [Phytophthora idaei]